jgi:hypothetical protein
LASNFISLRSLRDSSQADIALAPQRGLAKANNAAGGVAALAGLL